MEFSITGLFSKCDQIRSFLQIWRHLLKKSLTENFIIWAMQDSTKFYKIHMINVYIHKTVPMKRQSGVKALKTITMEE